MNRPIKYTILMLLVGTAACSQLCAQMYPERKHIRRGNRDYEALDYAAGEQDYRTAVTIKPGFEPMFNLGDAIYKQERFEEAENTFKTLTEDPMLTPEQRAKAFYNLGNTYFSQQKLPQAATSYVESLLLNPSDMEAKYNLAYVLELLKNQPPQDGGGGENDQNQDQDQDNQDGEGQQNPQQGDEDQDQQDQNDDGQQEQDGDGNQDNKDGEGNQDNNDNKGGEDKPEPSESQQREGAMSRADAEQLLEAIQQEEDKARDKANEKKAVVVGRSGKNW